MIGFASSKGKVSVARKKKSLQLRSIEADGLGWLGAVRESLWCLLRDCR